MKNPPCGLGGHPLRSRTIVITDPHLISFIQKVEKAYDPAFEVCYVCYRAVKKAFEFKCERLAAYKQSLINAETTSTSSSMDSFDKLVHKTPRNLALRHITKEGMPSRGPGTSSSVNLPSSQTIESSESLEQLPSTSTLSQTATNSPATATTSSAAAARSSLSTAVTASKRTHEPDELDSDDEISDISPYAWNGTRLPHVQPLPKRRQGVQLNEDVMRHYVADIIGG